MMTSFWLTTIWLFVAVVSSVAPAKDYVVEVYLVVEPQVIRNYMKIGYSRESALENLKGDIDFIIYEVNRYYRSMKKHEENIEVRVKKLDILDRDLFPTSKLVHGDKVVADFSIEVFKDFLKETRAYDKIGYDLAYVYTGYDVIGAGGSSSILGYATVEAVCEPDSGLGIVEFDMTQKTAITTAHEMAHNLGASHDHSHEGGGHGDCEDSEGFIMAAISKVSSKHRWEFSSCTAQQIKSHLNKLDATGNNCLTKTTTPPSGFRLSSQSGRDIMDVQKICQRARKEKKSYFCAFREFYNNEYPKGDMVCQYLYCGPLLGSRCLKEIPTEGMVCDKGKRCFEGKCLPAPPDFPTPKDIDSDCVFGDIQAGFVSNVRADCRGYLDHYMDLQCKVDEIRKESCCATCSKRRLDIEGCEWGDGNPSCPGISARLCTNPSNAQLCCYSCSKFKKGKRDIYDSLSIPAPVLGLKEVALRLERSVPVKIDDAEEGDYFKAID